MVPASPGVVFGAREDVAALQILLDRRGASPGVIDGHFGSNVDKAIVSYRAITGENLKSTDAEGIKKALAASGGDPFTNYTITAEDAAGPFVASVPADYGEKAKLERLSYTSVPEMLAERFHMDENLPEGAQPRGQFRPRRDHHPRRQCRPPLTTPVAASSPTRGGSRSSPMMPTGKLVVAYPATIGSTDTPSPTGTHEVSRVAFDPDYTYNPNLNFKQGENSRS